MDIDYIATNANGNPINRENVKEVEDSRSVNEFIDDIDIELDARCKILRLKSKELSDSLKSVFLIEIVKLSKKFKSMKMKDFLGSSDSLKFLSNVENLVQQHKSSVKTAIHTNHQQKDSNNKNDQTNVLDSIRKRAREKDNALRKLISTDTTNTKMATSHKTPARNNNKSYTYNSAAKTPLIRDPMMGETIVSANGSPLGVFSAVRAKVRPHAALTPTISLALPGIDSGFVEITNPNDFEQIDEENKKIALKELQNLEQTVKQLISKIKS